MLKLILMKDGLSLSRDQPYLTLDTVVQEITGVLIGVVIVFVVVGTFGDVVTGVFIGVVIVLVVVGTFGDDIVVVGIDVVFSTGSPTNPIGAVIASIISWWSNVDGVVAPDVVISGSGFLVGESVIIASIGDPEVIVDDPVVTVVFVPVGVVVVWVCVWVCCCGSDFLSPVINIT